MSSKGYRHTEEAKLKIREAMKSRVVSNVTKLKLSIANKGKKLTEEQKQKLSAAKKGKPGAKGRKASEETRRKLSKSHKGKIPSNKGKKMSAEICEIYRLAAINKYKNGYSRKKDPSLLVKNEKKHLDSQYVLWRDAVKRRDNYKCKIGGDGCSGKLEAHHIKPWRSYVELRYEINNGITLCHAHHPRKRAEEKRLESFLMNLVSVSNE